MTVQTLTSIFNQLLPEPQSGLLSGILFGTKASLSPELMDALITTGTLHIIALSGTNISLLTKIVNDLFLNIFSIMPRRLAAVITMVVITGFILFVGPTPSVVRAGIMGAITLISVVTGRLMIGIVSWLIAIGIMLIIRPLLITDLSFQLSALASLGIVLFSKQEKQKRNFLFDELHTTLAAQVFTIPLIFITFGRLSLISPLSNILIGWTIPIIMGLGFSIALIGLFFLPLAQIIAWFTWVFLQYVVMVVEWTSRVPGASVGN